MPSPYYPRKPKYRATTLSDVGVAIHGMAIERMKSAFDVWYNDYRRVEEKIAMLRREDFRREGGLERMIQVYMVERYELLLQGMKMGYLVPVFQVEEIEGNS